MGPRFRGDDVMPPADSSLRFPLRVQRRRGVAVIDPRRRCGGAAPVRATRWLAMTVSRPHGDDLNVPLRSNIIILRNNLRAFLSQNRYPFAEYALTNTEET